MARPRRRPHADDTGLAGNSCGQRSGSQDDSERRGIGPSVSNLVGRPAGSIADYSYSDANRHSGIVWDLAALDRYLTAPQAMVPGTKMTFPSIKNDEQRAAVIAYLETLKP